VGDVVRISGLISQEGQHLNGNFGKITDEMPNGRFIVVPFTKFEGGIRVLCEEETPVKIKRANLLIISVNPEEHFSAERRSHLEEIYRLQGKDMKPSLLCDLCFLVRFDKDYERALNLYKELYFSPNHLCDAELGCSIVIAIMELLVLLKRPHAALDMLAEFSETSTTRQTENLIKNLVSIAQQLKMDDCAEMALKKLLEVCPTSRSAREKLAAYYQAKGRMEEAIEIYKQSLEEPEYVIGKTSKLRNIIEKGKYQVLPGTCSRSTEEPFSWKE